MTKETKNSVSDVKKKIGMCSYPPCKKDKVEVEICPYCNEYFCSDHIKPKPPRTLNLPDSKLTVKERGEYEYHPCANYYDYLVKEEKEQEKKIAVSVSKMPRGPPVSIRVSYDYGHIQNKKKHTSDISSLNEKGEINKPLPEREEKFLNCEKCGRRTSQRDIKKIFSSILDRNVYLCSSCYSFGNKVIEQIEHDNQKEDHKKIEKEKPDGIAYGNQKEYPQKIKVFSILLIVLIVVGVILGFIFFRGSEQSNLNKKDLVTIANLKQNLQIYINQTVIIKASYIDKHQAYNWTLFRLDDGTEQMGAIAYDYINQSAINNKDISVFYWEGKIREAVYNGVIEPQLVVTKIQI